MSKRRALVALFASALFTSFASRAHAEGHPGGAALLRVLGSRAATALTVDGDLGRLSALVRLPPGVTAESLGLEPVAPGFARLRGGALAILAFDSAHPTIPIELAPPLHTLLNKAGEWTHLNEARLEPNSSGAGALVGVADTGLDVSHPDFIDANGKSRVAWILDLSVAPLGLYPDLESTYGIKDANGTLVAGAVAQGTDLDRLSAQDGGLPTDEVGHGTHVTSLAAGNGGVKNHTAYVGFASDAQILFARITRDSTDSIDNDDLVRGVQFIYDRADFMQKPVAVNLSLGSDFGPHDGTMAWEEAIASFVGPDKPGHALVAAAGNSGSIVDSPVHQSVRVSSGARMRVPIATNGAVNGALEVWVAMRSGASLSVGLDGPSGTLISPVAEGSENGDNTAAFNAGVINGSGPSDSPVPASSHGAVVVINGAWPTGTYNVTFEGDGTADLYIEGTGDVAIGQNAGFLGPVREGTINLPATNPSIIGVGCTVNRPTWVDVDDETESQSEPVLDAVGGRPLVDPSDSTKLLARPVQDGEMCWFSSAGPTLTGVPKPEIAAPGGIVVGAMSQQALPGSPNSIFSSTCPSKDGGTPDDLCLEIDALHAVSQGTSMAAPMVTGTIAVLFARDPTLTQDRIVGLLQAGAHPFRGAALYDDQSGPGELDVAGTLDALDQSYGSAGELLPDPRASWLTLSSSYAAADGSTPVTAILELRTTNAAHRADVFDPTRLQPVLKINGTEQPPPTLIRRAPGVWFFVVTPPVGLGGSSMTLGATFDGQPIVTAKTIPIAADVWRAEYSSEVSGSGCSVARPGANYRNWVGNDRASSARWLAWIFAAATLLGRGAVRLRRTRARSSH